MSGEGDAARSQQHGGGVPRGLSEVARRVDARLAALLPPPRPAPPPTGRSVDQAMRYSLLAGGKRIRPALCVLTAEHLGRAGALALDPACALEMVHTASLILDDLPAMDNATLRRGRPANHLVFGEDTALLAALGLLNRAYAVVASARGLDDALRLDLIRLLSGAIGSEAGIIAGQAEDLQAGGARDAPAVQRMHARKTGALFVAAAETGARAAGVPPGQLEAIRGFAHHLGLAFQTLDDLLDVAAGPEDTGKDVGQDRDKATLVCVLGPERARAAAERCIEDALRALAPLGRMAEPLAELARWVVAGAPAREGGARPATLSPAG